jgi:hypothetical protein
MAVRVPQVLVLLGALLAARLGAQDSAATVVLHGFGSWAYGKTANNYYLAGAPEGDYRQVSFALNLAARINDKFAIHAQAGLAEDEDGTHAILNYAFAAYQISDWLSVRMGQVKQPFGIFTEVLAVGTLRPFLDLPQAVYGPVGFVGDSYKGVGVFGTFDLSAWALDYDLYGGGTDLTKLAIPEQFYRGGLLDNAAQETELQSTRDVLGGRLVAHTPLRGLSVGGSAYTGVLNEPAANRTSVVAGQIQFASNEWAVESEISHLVQSGDEYATGAYVQAAYRFAPAWQIALQGDYLENKFVGINPAAAPSLQYHREGAVALNFWISREFVVKTEFHLVNGNRFAMPRAEDLRAIVAAGELRQTTHLFQFGAQFTF